MKSLHAIRVTFMIAYAFQIFVFDPYRGNVDLRWLCRRFVLA